MKNDEVVKQEGGIEWSVDKMDFSENKKGGVLMKKHKVGIFVVILTAMFLLFQGTARAGFEEELAKLSPELQKLFWDIIETRYPPVVYDVKLDPEAPAEDEPVTIKVQAYNDSKLTDSETSAVYVHYSTDGGKTWEEIELDTEDDKNWEGELPGQPSGTEVLYSIRAEDDSNNVYVEAVCPMEEEPSEEYLENDCISTEDYSNCTNLPVGCMFAMGKDEEGDDPADEIADDLDFWDVRAGEGEDRYYIDVAVQGKIDGGTVSPMNLNGYVVIVLNPDKNVAGNNIRELAKAGVILGYAPQAEISGGLLLPCFVGYERAGDFAQDGDALTCDAKKNHLMLSFDKDVAALAENPSEYLTYIVIDIHITN
ncbi:MAG: hypothetical protein AB1546_09655, partial [bacterium]